MNNRLFIIFVLLVFSLKFLYANYTIPAIPFDITGNGYDEIITANFYEELFVYKINETNNEPEIMYKANTNGIVNTLPAIGDINNDGRLNIVTLTASGYLQVFDALTGKENNNFNIFVGQPRNVAPVLADVTGDNRLEIIIGSDRLNIFDSKGNHIFNSPYNFNSSIEYPIGIFDYTQNNVNDIFIILQDRRVYVIDAVSGNYYNINKLNNTIVFGESYILNELSDTNGMEIIHIKRHYRQFVSYNFLTDETEVLDYLPQVVNHSRPVGIANMNNDNYQEIIILVNIVESSDTKSKICLYKTQNKNEDYLKRYYDSHVTHTGYMPSEYYEYYTGSFLDYDNDGNLEFIIPGNNDYLYITKYLPENNHTLHLYDSIPVKGNGTYYSATIGDVTGNRKADIIYNDREEIFILNTNSSIVASPYPNENIFNTNNSFHIIPPVITSSTPIITTGNSYNIEWRKPFFYDTYSFSYSFDGNNYTDYSNDTSIQLNNLEDGIYTFYLKAKNSDNKSTLNTALLDFIIDNKPPEIYFVSPNHLNTVNDIFSIRAYINDTNLKKWKLYTKINGETNLVNTGNYNSDSDVIAIIDLSHHHNIDTVTLILAAYEIEDNNYSETEIIVKISKDAYHVGPATSKTISLQDNEAEISIYKMSFAYNYILEFYKLDRYIHSDFLEYNIYYIGENIEINIPLKLSIKTNDSNSKLYYTNSIFDTHYEIISSLYDNNNIIGNINKAGYYFTAPEELDITDTDSTQNTTTVFNILQRIITLNQNINFSFNLVIPSNVYIYIYDINGRLIKKFINGSFFDTGNHLYSVDIKNNDFSAGLYIAQFKSKNKVINKTFFVK